MNENEISKIILDCAFKVHTALGPGLLESAYKECLAYELKKAGLNVEKEEPIPLVYAEVKLDCGYRLDLLVENKVVIELKVCQSLQRCPCSSNINIYALVWMQTWFTAKLLY